MAMPKFIKGQSQQKQIVDEIIKGIQDGSLHVENVEVRWHGQIQRYHLQVVDPQRSMFLSSVAQAMTTPSWQQPAMNPGWSSMSSQTVTISGTGLDLGIQTEKSLEDLGTAIDPIIGFRDFYLGTGIYPMPGLISRNKMPWPMREPVRAFCRAGALSVHDAPDPDCECGIYAFSKPTNPALLEGAVIWGEISMWGDVLICPEGYRSEFAYPKTLFIKDTNTKAVKWLRDHLADSYGVPVFLLERKEGKTTSEVISELLASEGMS